MNPTSFSPLSLGALSLYAPPEPTAVSAPTPAPVDSRKTIQAAAPTQFDPNGTGVLQGVTFDPHKHTIEETPIGVDTWSDAFSGLDKYGLGAFGSLSPLGNPNDPSGFSIRREDPNGNPMVYQTRNLSVNPDGTVSWNGDWSNAQRVSDAQFWRDGLALAAAGFGGAQLMGVGGAGAGAGGLSGMDLAADAAVGTGNNILTAGSMLGDPALIAGTGIPQFQQLPGYGDNVATLADASGNSPFTQSFDPLNDYMTSGGAEGSLVDSGVTAATPYDNLLPYMDPYGAGSGWGGDTLSAMGATNDTAPGLLDMIKGYGGGAMNWLGNLASGDKTALNQARMGLGAVGLIGQLLQGNKPRNQLTPGQLQAAVKGPYDKWTGGNQAAFDKFAGTDLSKFQFTPPRLAHGGPAPHDAHCRCTMCSGGAVSSYARGSLVRGPGGGQDDQVHAMLSPGEYVMDADTVSALGDGDNASGADKLDQMRENIRAHKRSAPPSKIPPRAHAPEHYLHKKGR